MTTPPSLDELSAKANALPSLPEVVSYLTRSLNDEGANVDTLAHYINSDPAIVARLLAAANSVASGLSTHIFSAKQAFLVLGIDGVVGLLIGQSQSQLGYLLECLAVAQTPLVFVAFLEGV